MRFGKRRGKDAPEGEAAADAPAGRQSVTEDWLAPGDGADVASGHRMAPPGGYAAAAQDPVVEAEPEAVAPAAEAVVEGEAYELPYEPPVVEAPAPAPAYEAPAYEAPAYEAPAYEAPVAARAPYPVESMAAAQLADGTPQHEPGVKPRSGGGAWPEPAFDLAERPEILVGAAFGGGLLLALILRRLGH